MSASASARALSPARVAEAALWATLLVAVFNFTPQLFTSDALVDEPTWRKAIKDLPLFLLFTVALLQRRSRGGEVAGRARAIYGVAFLALAAFMAIDFIARRPDLPEFLVSARYYVVYPLLVLVVSRMEISRAAVLRIAAALCAVAALESLIAVYEFSGVIADTFYANYVTVAGDEKPRAIGTLGNPNNLALFLALPALLLAAGAVARGALRWILLGLVLVGMVLSFSKAVGLALAIAVVAMEWTRRRELDLVRMIVAGGLGIGLFVLAIASRFGGELSVFAVFGGRGSAVEQAWDIWTSDVKTFLIGEGFGSQIDASGGTISQIVTDNMALMLALEGGLLAVILFAVIVAHAFRALLAARRNDGSPLVMALFGYAVFFLLYSPFVVNFRLFPGALLFWLAVGVAVAVSGQPAPSSARPEPSGRRAAERPAAAPASS